MAAKKSEKKSSSTKSALVAIGGKQILVTPGESVVLNLARSSQEGAVVKADKVLLSLSGEGAGLTLGTGEVSFTVTGQVKTPKVLIFKKKRRKGYTKKQSHRQVLVEATVNEF